MYTVRAHATLQTTTLNYSQAENKFANMDIYMHMAHRRADINVLV